MNRSHLKARRALTMIPRNSHVNVRRRSLSITLLRNDNRAKTRAFIIALLRARLICRGLGAIILVAIRLRTLHRLPSFSIRASVRVTFATSAFRGFLVVSLTIARGKHRRVGTAPLMVPCSGVCSLFFNVARRLLAQRVEVNLSYANVGRARRIMSFHDNTRHKA